MFHSINFETIFLIKMQDLPHVILIYIKLQNTNILNFNSGKKFYIE